VQDDQAEAVVAAEECGSNIVSAQLGVAGDEAIAIDDNVAAGNDGGEGTLLRVRGVEKARAEDVCCA
jgi:hypothetical protein